MCPKDGSGSTCRPSPTKAWSVQQEQGHYLPAIFAAFPIANLAVVKGDDGEHERPAELASESKLNVRIAND